MQRAGHRQMLMDTLCLPDQATKLLEQKDLHYTLPPCVQDGDAPPEVLLTAVPAALVEPDSGAAAEALAAGAAYPALQPADAGAAAEVARAALQSAVAASSRAAAAGAALRRALPRAALVMDGAQPCTVLVWLSVICCSGYPLWSPHTFGLAVCSLSPQAECPGLASAQPEPPST